MRFNRLGLEKHKSCNAAASRAALHVSGERTRLGQSHDMGNTLIS
jgi:hypothetical protein